MVVTSSWQYRIRPLILSCFGIIIVSLGACQSSFLQQPLALDQDDLVKLMENKDCPGCNLVGADLSGMGLEGSDLSFSNLQGARLRGTDLRRARLRGAKLTEADLSLIHI